ncbi:MAG TPA: glycyl-radical enzyme activating protein [bacterium]|nr:glycyl-radical enzyme activating protein [bacterium]
MTTPQTEPLRALVTNIQGFSTEDGPGIRTTVFFKGCPLACPWCHNPEGLAAKEELIFYAEKCIGCKECVKVCGHGAPVPGGPRFEECERCFKCVEACPATARRKMGEWYSVERLAAQVLRDRVYYETSGGGVTASGGEAMIWAEFLAGFFKRLKAEGIHTALDTSGVVGGERLKAVLEHTDLALVDLKIMDPERHRAVIGVELSPILAHIREIDDSGTAMLIRVPVVPGYTDDPANISAMAEFARTLEHLQLIDLLPYHRMAEPKYRHLGKKYSVPDLKPPSAEAMESIKQVFTAAGIKAVIAGKD